jgi:2-oxoisovalerate dehydrogenase E1 component
MTEPIDDRLLAALRGYPDTVGGSSDADPVAPGSALTVDAACAIFQAQIGSRHLDLAARRLRAAGRGYYTIGSSGHESNAAVAAALRPTDPALLHYRSGAFFLHRAAQLGDGRGALRDVLLGIVAATAEPIAGGRHKVFGRHDLAIIPQTSTIASHLPRAFGLALMLSRAHRFADCPWPSDAVVVCSFGDASANHSTALGAINAARNAAYRGLPVPLLLVCEDNGIGISTPTPDGWIAANYATGPGLDYFDADGTDLPAVYAAATAAADHVRRHRRPAFLHLRTVRLLGHAGSDVETAYRTTQEITADYPRDPVLTTAALLIERGHRSAADLLARYQDTRATVAALAAEVAGADQLDSAAAVVAPLTEAARRAREASAPAAAPVPAGLTLAQAINTTLHDVLRNRTGAIVFGEDVARKGGVYGVTRGLQRDFGAARVFDTILDEQTILGIALGAGLAGLLPIPEIQYLAYLHNALDQIRGEGATLEFFSTGQYRNPAVLRVAGYGYQRGFGGHFHNDNSVAALLDIPGIVVASPAHPDDAAAMLAGCAAAAAAAGTFSVFLEPIALYHARDLHEPGDGGWLSGTVGALGGRVGTARIHGAGTDLTLVTFGNGVPMSLRVARRLRAARGIDCRVVDLRWLAPLPVADLLREAAATGRVLIVDETRRTGGVGQQVLSALVEGGFGGRIARVASADSFIPLGDAALRVLLDEDTVERAALQLCDEAAGISAAAARARGR